MADISNNPASQSKKNKRRGKKRKRDELQADQPPAPQGPQTAEELQDQTAERLTKIRKLYINKQRTLILSSRGINYRYRHLLNDLTELLPHAKKDNKLDTKDLWNLNEVCDMKHCNNCIFFECKKGSDLYMWVSRVPGGPSLKFHVLNAHTMDELKFTGNHLKGSRPILSFDSAFDATPHYQIMKEVLTQVFGTPKGHPKSKPFIDHVLSFNIVDNKVWFRNYQIGEEVGDGKEPPKKVLTEVGPRFVLNPIKIVSGGFSGATIYENPHYVSPNAVRAAHRAKVGMKYANRLKQESDHHIRKVENTVEPDEIEDTFKGDD